MSSESERKEALRAVNEAAVFTKRPCSMTGCLIKDALGKARVALSRPAMNDDPIVQVSGFGVENTSNTQCNYMLTAVTRSGRVLMSVGDGEWSDVGPKAAAPEPNGETP